MASEMTLLKAMLIKRIEKDYQEECCALEERLDHIKTLLLTVSRTGSWKLPITIRGMDTSFPEYEKDLTLLERCGILRSRVKHTEHNSYRVYEFSEEGAALAKTLT